MSLVRSLYRISTAIAVVLTAGLASGSSASAATVDCTTGAAVLAPTSWRITHLDGSVTVTNQLSNTVKPGTVRAGDVIVGTLRIAPSCGSVVVSGASYT